MNDVDDCAEITPAQTISSRRAATGERFGPGYPVAAAAEVESACRAAGAAALGFRRSPGDVRAQLLDSIAAAMLASKEAIVDLATAETGLDQARIEGELGRTTGQLTRFAAVARADDWRRTVVVEADLDRTPAPRPELRRWNRAIGPVAVFAASNFPLAFSVAGGDAASALAVGCPVVVKAHESHPGTSDLVGRLVADVVASLGLAPGVFAVLQGPGVDLAPTLVRHPAIRAVAFTGSQAGGMAIVDLARGRPDSIPVFAEMGSRNPLVVLPGALADRGAQTASAVAASVALGAGQFCTKPGLVLGVAGPHWDEFASEVATALDEGGAAVGLNERIVGSYGQGVAALAEIATPATPIVETASRTHMRPVAFRTTGDEFTARGDAFGEVFGPAVVLIECVDEPAVMSLVAGLDGQLTATVHHGDGDEAVAGQLFDLLGDIAGRVVSNGVPTGVEVSDAMQHGGPYPATTDSRFTSVGAAAVERFVRPVCYQGVAEGLLPAS